MSSTPKKVRRNGGSCICPAASQSNFIDNHRFADGFCKYGYCYSAKCWDCRGELFGMGPVGCPCDNPPRWTRYPGMRQPGHWEEEKRMYVPSRAAVKPGTTKRRSR
jgi:hypothetical protein